MYTQLQTWSLAEMLMPEQQPGDARQDAVRWGASLTIVKGQIVAQKTADKLIYSYNNANADGTETAVGIAMYSFKTDASGNVYYSDAIIASEINPPNLTSPIWKSGIFDPAKLTGLDTAARVDLQVRTLPNGFIQIPG